MKTICFDNRSGEHLISEKGLLQSLKDNQYVQQLVKLDVPPKFTVVVSGMLCLSLLYSSLCLYEFQTEAGTCSVILYNCRRTIHEFGSWSSPPI